MDIKLGLIGFGSMGRTHANAVCNLPYYYSPLGFTASYKTVCTRHIETANKAAADFGFIAATDNEDDIINDPEITAIDICTPNIYHYRTIKKAISAGKHILCEKPLCVTSEQANEVARLAEEAGIIAQITFNYRYMPPILRAKQLINDGAIGDIISFRSCYRHNSCTDPDKKAGWKQDRDVCGGGVLFDLGSHAIDLVYYLCGSFKNVSGRSQIAYKNRVGLNGDSWNTNADEAFYITAELDCGALGTVEANKISLGANDGLTVEIYGTRGSLHFNLMDPNWLYFYSADDNGSFDRSVMNAHDLGGQRGYTAIECVGRLPAPGGMFPGIKAPVGWMHSHIGNMYNFCSALNEGRQPSPSFSEAAHVQAVMEAAYKSDADGLRHNVK